MHKYSLSKTKIKYVYRPQVSDYHSKVPFEPPEKYPELFFVSKVDRGNKIYAMVRELLRKIGLDKENIGTSRWNPFKSIITPGDNVIIKPNFVTNKHYLGENAILSTIVHGSIIRPILDYTWLALQGKGSITIADTPVEPADFDSIMVSTGVREMVKILKEYGYTSLRVIDLRPTIAYENNDGDLKRVRSSGDPLDYVTIDLSKDSCFSDLNGNPDIHYYTLADKTVDHLDPKESKRSVTDSFHNSKNHKYVISKTVLDSDVILNIAKLKTHCKACVSLTLKNMIGIVNTKDCMPHHRPGSPPEGDSFPDYPAAYYTTSRKVYRDLRRKLHMHKFPGVKFAINALRRKRVLVGQHIEHGNWKGNDTIWRTILDINRIVLYADKNGRMMDTPQRKYFGLIDGIIGQHGDAPISGEPIKCGVIIGGHNPVVLDSFAAKLMGIDYDIIKTISKAREFKKWPLLTEDVDLNFNDFETPNLNFTLPKGWK